MWKHIPVFCLYESVELKCHLLLLLDVCPGVEGDTVSVTTVKTHCYPQHCTAAGLCNETAVCACRTLHVSISIDWDSSMRVKE